MNAQVQPTMRSCLTCGDDYECACIDRCSCHGCKGPWWLNDKGTERQRRTELEIDELERQLRLDPNYKPF